MKITSEVEIPVPVSPWRAVRGQEAVSPEAEVRYRITVEVDAEGRAALDAFVRTWAGRLPMRTEDR